MTFTEKFSPFSLRDGAISPAVGKGVLLSTHLISTTLWAKLTSPGGENASEGLASLFSFFFSVSGEVSLREAVTLV